MKILITGGNGFIGGYLKDNLINYDITSITRKELNLLSSEETTNFFKDKWFDVVIHTAINGGSRLVLDDDIVKQNNIKMFNNLLVNKQNFNKMINIGSGAEIYAKNTPYGLSKKIIREILLDEDNFYNIRVYNVFNENELDRRFIKSNIKRYKNKEPMIIHKDKLMDFFYMNDLLKIINYYIIEKNPPKEVDCVYKNKYKLSDITKIINNLSNYSVDTKIINKGIDDDYVGNFYDLGLNYVGLKESIIKVYKKLK